MNTPRTHKKVIAGLGVTIGLLLTAGVAEAAWTTSGSGTATAKAGTAVGIGTVTATASATGLLYPGGPAGTLAISVTNPNPFPIVVTTIAGNGTITVSPTGTTCTTATHGVSFVNQSSLSLAVPANSTGTALTVSSVVTMATTSDNACQGATFAIPVILTGQSG